MHLQVFLTPAELIAASPPSTDIYIVIDVIRATTTIATILDCGAHRIYAANSLQQAQEAAQFFPTSLLCGERSDMPLPAPGFDFGNSPTKFIQANLTDRQVILTTTNGTQAFFACPSKSVCFAGCFYNAHRVIAHALRLAQCSDSTIFLVCAGEFGCFALDDTACAGYLAQELLQLQPTLQLHESAYAAIALYQAYPPSKLLQYCSSASSLRKARLQEDLEFCMQIDGGTSIPQIIGQEAQTGMLILEEAKNGLA